MFQFLHKIKAYVLKLWGSFLSIEPFFKIVLVVCILSFLLDPIMWSVLCDGISWFFGDEVLMRILYDPDILKLLGCFVSLFDSSLLFFLFWPYLCKEVGKDFAFWWILVFLLFSALGFLGFKLL